MALGVAVVGLDHWYTAFGVLDTARKSDIAPLIAFAETEPARLAYAAEKYPGVLATANVDEAISAPGVGLVAICASTDQAPQIATTALRAGKHVVSVKPPARTLAELDEVLAVAAQTGRFYGSFEGMQRLNARATVLQNLIQNGEIGTPLSFHQVGHGGLPAPWPGQIGLSWWLDANKVPGGAWLDHAIYAVDLARFVFGGEVDFATGLIENRVQPDLSLEDYGISLMRLRRANGSPNVSLLFEDTWAANPGGGTSRYQIIGTDGSVRIDGSDWVVTKGGQETRHAIPAGPFFAFETLTDLLERDETPPFGPADARANLKACLAVYESAKVLTTL